MDWDNIIKSKKNVRTKDNISIGNVAANYDNYILVIGGVINKHKYKSQNHPSNLIMVLR